MHSGGCCRLQWAALPVVKQLKVHSMRAMEALAPSVPTLWVQMMTAAS